MTISSRPPSHHLAVVCLAAGLAWLSGCAATQTAIAKRELAALGNNSGRSTAGAALVGGLVETVYGAMVKDVYYSIVTDVQIKERLPKGKVARLDSQQTLQQGTGGADKVNYAIDTDMRLYQTRVMSTANKVNLDFAEAMPPLRAGLARSLGGLF